MSVRGGERERGVFQKLTASLILRHARRERIRTAQVSHICYLFLLHSGLNTLLHTPSSLSSFHSREREPGG